MVHKQARELAFKFERDIPNLARRRVCTRDKRRQEETRRDETGPRRDNKPEKPQDETRRGCRPFSEQCLVSSVSSVQVKSKSTF